MHPFLQLEDLTAKVAALEFSSIDWRGNSHSYNGCHGKQPMEFAWDLLHSHGSLLLEDSILVIFVYASRLTLR